MADAEEVQKVAKRLTGLLDRGLLPAGGPAEAAERLVERLLRPARVALLGLPGSGKSAVLNLLAGSTVVPESLRLPTIVVQKGDVARMQCTLSDGQIVTLPGSDLEQALPLSPALITLDLDIPALGVISLLEVAAGPMEAEQRRAALWAGKRADIIIWCSTAYLPKEQLVWEGMPDAYKDNGFLLLTKIDLLGGREAAAGMHQRVMQRATGEFRQVLPISARDAHASTTAGKPVDREKFRESGAAALISTIKSRVQMARQADLDTAELLIARHTEAAPVQQKPKFELRAVASAATLEPTEAALAAEAEALRRIATAATGHIDPVSPALPELAPLTAPASENSETARDPSTQDFEKPSPEIEVPEVDLGIILDTQPESQHAGAEGSPAPVLPPEVMETEEPQADPRTVDDEIPAEPQTGITSSAEDLNDLKDEAESTSVPPTGSEPQTEPGDAGTGFAARLKQGNPDRGPAPPDLVPLRATWKSRSDAVNAMPIVPKPEPNRNPTPRKLPPGLAGEARLVGRSLRPTEGQANSGAVEGKFSTKVDAAILQAEPSATEKGPSVPTEVDRRSARPTSVFGFRQKPEPEKRNPAAAPSLEADDSPQTDHPGDLEPQVLATEPEASPDDRKPPPSQDDGKLNAAAEPEPAPPPGMDHAAAPLSERLGRPRRPTSVIRVSRIIQPQPDPLASLPDGTGVASNRPEPVERSGSSPMEPAPAAIASPSPLGGPGFEKSLLAEAVEVILARSLELSDQIDPDEKPPVDLVLAKVGETVDQVAAIFSRAVSPELRRLGASLGDVQDVIMLMQLEKGRAPADDSLTLLLQLKREIETLAAK